jgi:hypothetical protein
MLIAALATTGKGDKIPSLSLRPGMAGFIPKNSTIIFSDLRCAVVGWTGKLSTGGGGGRGTADRFD